MARISPVSIKQEPAHHTLTLRRTIDFMQDYAAFADEALKRTSAYLDALGVFPMSGPIVCFHNTALERLDVEMGWQIAQPVGDQDAMTCQKIPARKVVTAIDLGPYEEQDPTLMDVLAWAEQHKLVQQGPIRYCYLNDTERPPAEYLTQMALPVG